MEKNYVLQANELPQMLSQYALSHLLPTSQYPILQSLYPIPFSLTGKTSLQAWDSPDKVSVCIKEQGEEEKLEENKILSTYEVAPFVP